MKKLLSSAFVFCLILCSNFTFAQNTITVKWYTPNQRVDGAVLPLTEIAGYEIKYLKAGGVATDAKRIVLAGNDKTQYDFDLPTQDTYVVSMAVFDTNGLYSDFMIMNYTFLSVKIKPLNFTISKKIMDVNGACQVDVNCKIVK